MGPPITFSLNSSTFGIPLYDEAASSKPQDIQAAANK